MIVYVQPIEKLLLCPIFQDTATLLPILYVIFYVYSLWLRKMGQQLTVEACPESLAALNGLAQKATTPPVAIRLVFVTDPPAHVPLLPVYLEIRLQHPSCR